MRRIRIAFCLGVLCVSVCLLGNAQAFTVTYNMGAFGLDLTTTTISEGETYVVQSATLPGLAAAYQPYWDALEGATMTIPIGAIDSDIVINVDVSNFVLLEGGFLNLGGEEIFLSLDYVVEGYEGSQFNFNEGYPMVLTFPLDSEFAFLLQAVGLDLTSPLMLAYWAGGEFVTVTTSSTETQLSAEISHLSTIVGMAGTPISVEGGTWSRVKLLFH
ncbi:MAG: hypothetical protein V1800_09185 [Candidatus Latescibacterota bacterium]